MVPTSWIVGNIYKGCRLTIPTPNTFYSKNVQTGINNLKDYSKRTEQEKPKGTHAHLFCILVHI